jgi:hypothetical protein
MWTMVRSFCPRGHPHHHFEVHVAPSILFNPPISLLRCGDQFGGGAGPMSIFGIEGIMRWQSASGPKVDDAIICV